MSLDNSGDEPTETTERANTTRRKLMAAGAASWATVTLAGCATGSGADTTTEVTTTAPQPKNYVVSEDLIAGSEGIPKDAGLVSGCSPTRTFVPGMEPVWHIGVYDPATGDPVSDEIIDSMVVELSTGKTVEMTWAGDAEEHAEPIWKGSYVIGEDAQPQTIDYTIAITDGDDNFQNVEVAENTFDIIEGVSPKNYVVTDELLASGSVPEGGLVSHCATSRAFSPGMTIVYHVGVYDPATGDPVSNDTISKMVSKQSNDVDVELTWAGDAEEHAEPIWKGSWVVPDDAPEETVTYEIQVTDDSDNFRDVNVEENSFDVVHLQ